jgi:hypothetical protein
VLDGEKNSRRRVLSHILRQEANVTADTSEARYFAKDKDVGEHRLLYVPIFPRTPLAVCAYIFPEKIGTYEHRLLYVPIFLSADQCLLCFWRPIIVTKPLAVCAYIPFRRPVFVLFLATCHCYNDKPNFIFLHRTAHTAGTTFLFSRVICRPASLR